MSDFNFEPQKIEKKWQKYWEDNEIYKCDLDDDSKPKYYIVSMYPYPSGTLHIGHVMEYTMGDLVARYRRMKGYNVLFPMGWDSFGLPAENAAIRENIPPAVFTYGNIDKMRDQMKKAGWSFRWDSEIAVSHEGYYKWNQWLFLKMFEKGLAYKKESAVNWCDKCMTVLANEQVVDGKCERHGTDVHLRQLDQWFYKITDFADDLLNDFEEEWDPKVVAMQKAWIGRSEGARIDFKIESTGEILPVFTTRPDTIYGVTFMSLAPEHPLVNELVVGTEREKEVTEFVKRVCKEPSFERSAEGKEKEGVFTGHYVINPVNGEKAQLWVANYALMEYGTGAVMAVPAHDQRDFEFAKKYDIPMKIVIKPESEELILEEMESAYTEPGIQVNSGKFDGMKNTEAMTDIIKYFDEEKIGGATINYRLRDWLISRQRYWGTPIPVIYCDSCGIVPVPENELPVKLPDGVDFRPTGKSPLATVDEFLNVKCPKCGKDAKRETDTMDTFVDSSWYFFRYLTPRDNENIVNKELVKKWLPIDQYIGGIEHANGHLVFSRFFSKVFKQMGLSPYDEYAKKMFTHGMVCMVAHYCPNCNWMHRDEVKDGICQRCNTKVKSELTKMSKSKFNTVSPDEIFEQYGADALRLYILFMGPPDKSTEYNSSGMVGCYRFLKRVFDFVNENIDALKTEKSYDGDGNDLDKDNKALRTKLHQTIKKVSHDNENYAYNTGVAAIMELFNSVKATKNINPQLMKQCVKDIILMLNPMTPHFCEEMWEMMGSKDSIQFENWPEFSEDAAKEEEIQVVFQVNGKVRGKDSVPAGTDDKTLEKMALENENVMKLTDGKTIRKVIVVKGRLVNVVNN